MKQISTHSVLLFKKWMFAFKQITDLFKNKLYINLVSPPKKYTFMADFSIF